MLTTPMPMGAARKILSIFGILLAEYLLSLLTLRDINESGIYLVGLYPLQPELRNGIYINPKIFIIVRL